MLLNYKKTVEFPQLQYKTYSPDYFQKICDMQCKIYNLDYSNNKFHDMQCKISNLDYFQK
jgi:hypothetical protein